MVQAAQTKKIFDGRFEILGIVGRGSQSVVYHARNAVSPDSHVALKVLVNHQNKAHPANLGEKLRKEALAMVAARHRYVVRIEDFHSIDSLCYLSMEYAPEGDLRKFTSAKGGKISALHAERFFKQVVEALCAVHKSGIIHRDIKPDNILVLNEREIRLADFGVAVLPGDDSSIEELQKGVGTFSYMAPEVLEGKEYKEAADLYSLGVAFYELLTGAHPFEGTNLIDQLKVRQDGNVPSIKTRVKDLPDRLATAITRCIAFHKENRPKSAEELLEYLNGNGSLGPLVIKTDAQQEKQERPVELSPAAIGSSPTKEVILPAMTKSEVITNPHAPIIGSTPSSLTKPSTSSSTTAVPNKPVAPDLLAVKREAKEAYGDSRTTQVNTPSRSVKEILGEQTRTNQPPLKRFPLAALIVVAFLAFAYYRYSSSVPESVEYVPKARLADDQPSQQKDEAVSSEHPLMPSPKLTGSAFPLLGAGIYHGEIHGLYPGAKHSVTFISFPEKQRIAVIVGMEGWNPAVISTEGLKEGDVLKVSANGFVLQLTGRILEDGEIVGYFKNLVVREQGEWRVKLLSGRAE